jgi:hypothetical protein
VLSRQGVLGFSATCLVEFGYTRSLAGAGPGDVAAQLFQRLPVVGAATHN